ncbi:MAG: hypothetical protein KF819_26465 [Labilithrix sp.]|nr:hypothetical protein [Labilithrix sp.]
MLHLRALDKQTEGSFQMLVDANTADAAADRFEARLIDPHAKSTLFYAGPDVFLEYMLDVSGAREVPALVNYVSGRTPPTAPVIYSGVPEQADVDIATYGAPEEESEVDMPPLVSFRPRKVKRKRPRAREAAARA